MKHQMKNSQWYANSFHSFFKIRIELNSFLLFCKQVSKCKLLESHNSNDLYHPNDILTTLFHIGVIRFLLKCAIVFYQTEVILISLIICV